MKSAPDNGSIEKLELIIDKKKCILNFLIDQSRYNCITLLV